MPRPALLLQTVFNLGGGLAMARLGAQAREVSQLLPFLLRTWRYFCGVMYSVSVIAVGMPHAVQKALAANPAAVYISLTRWALLATERSDEPGAKPYRGPRSSGEIWSDIPLWGHRGAVPASLITTATVRTVCLGSDGPQRPA